MQAMEWNGMEWDGMGWNGMEWNARLLALHCIACIVLHCIALDCNLQCNIAMQYRNWNWNNIQLRYAVAIIYK